MDFSFYMDELNKCGTDGDFVVIIDDKRSDAIAAGIGFDDQEPYEPHWHIIIGPDGVERTIRESDIIDIRDETDETSGELIVTIKPST